MTAGSHLGAGAIVLGLCAAVMPQAAHAAETASQSPWTGLWILDPSRPEPQGAADAYRLTVGADRSIVWEIPSIDERNTGSIGGAAMPIIRHGRPTGQSLRVWAETPRVLRYEVSRGTHPAGSGRMTLAADGRSWTDIPLDHGVPVTRLTMVYARH